MELGHHRAQDPSEPHSRLHDTSLPGRKVETSCKDRGRDVRRYGSTGADASVLQVPDHSFVGRRPPPQDVSTVPVGVHRGLLLWSPPILGRWHTGDRSTSGAGRCSCRPDHVGHDCYASSSPDLAPLACTQRVQATCRSRSPRRQSVKASSSQTPCIRCTSRERASHGSASSGRSRTSNQATSEHSDTAEGSPSQLVARK